MYNNRANMAMGRGERNSSPISRQGFVCTIWDKDLIREMPFLPQPQTACLLSAIKSPQNHSKSHLNHPINADPGGQTSHPCKPITGLK